MAKTTRLVDWSFYDSGLLKLPYLKPGWTYAIPFNVPTDGDIRFRLSSTIPDQMDPIMAYVLIERGITHADNDSGPGNTAQIRLADYDWKEPGLFWVSQYLSEATGQLTLTVEEEVAGRPGRFELLKIYQPPSNQLFTPSRTPRPLQTPTPTPTNISET